MRIIVALALVSVLAAAQPAREIARLEASIAQHPEDVEERERLVTLYSRAAPGDEAAQEGRRKQILWLIENRPDWRSLAVSDFVLAATGPKRDPQGHEQAARLWRLQVEKPAASAQTLANAAYFFAIPDRGLARSFIDRAGAGPLPSRVRAILDMLDWLGATELDSNENIVRADAAKRKYEAFSEVDSSEDAVLLGRAGEFLLHQFAPALRGILDPQDAADLAGRWLTRARRLEPGNPLWATNLASSYLRQAQSALDPRARIALLKKGLDLAAPHQLGSFQNGLAQAEFDAGDDASAENNGIALVESSNPSDVFWGHTILGRIALVRGDVARARAHLLDSARIQIPQFIPGMALAQDLLEHGERDTVVQFLELCRAFWKNDRGFIDHFVPVIQRGGKPDLLAFYNNVAPQRPPKLPAPEVIAGAEPRWKPVAGAESYVVEWDVQQKNGGWLFDTDGTVRVIPTGATSAQIDEPRPIRWRVYAVSRRGAGAVTAWQIVHGDAGARHDLQ